VGRLEGKVAIITGTGSGMGREAAILFAKEGAKIVGVDKIASTGEETLSLIEATRKESIFIQANVSVSEDVEKVIKTAVDTYGKLNILYNNAAIPQDPEGVPVADCKEEDFDKLIAVNLKGVFLMMKYAVPEMVKSGGGSIINTSSISAIEGWPTLPAYSASKGGVVSLSKSVAMAYLTKHIRVNCIQPGPTLTQQVDIFMKSAPEFHKTFLTRCPSGRFGKPKEIAMLALFLASDESSVITGTEIVADLGFSCAGFPIRQA
jgi:NAD(P)-dependent dehydrogenase (short-subunit alcohol dehydrogenase family)